MGLFSEVKKALGAELSAAVQYTVIDGKGGYFSNVKKLVEFSPTKIVLLGKGGKVSVEGENLQLGKCLQGDVVVYGKIIKTERV